MRKDKGILGFFFYIGDFLGNFLKEEDLIFGDYGGY